MSMKAYEEFAQAPLAFPIGGKVYTVPALGLQESIRLERLLSGDEKFPDGAPAEDLWKIVLGPVWDQMVEDNVPSPAAARAGMAALTDFRLGRDAAEAAWEAGDNPEALAAAMAAKATQTSTPKPAASKRSRGTASATPTQKPASSRATTSRKR
jgi:hypothetical protein